VLAKPLNEQARNHRITRVAGYVIVDLESTTGGVETLRFVARKPSLWWTYAVSAFHPPYRLVRTPGAPKDVLRKLSH
jgi:hypothetical protein